MDAAKKANAYKFVSNFPDGFDTLVGERGLLLSGMFEHVLVFSTRRHASICPPLSLLIAMKWSFLPVT